MADYKTNSTNVYLSLSGSPDPKLGVHATLAYTMSKAKWDAINFPDPSDRTLTTDGDPELQNANYDFSLTPTYSDLDYGIIRLAGGFSYQVSPGVKWTADVDYADLTDDGIWVYGDETGSIYVIRTGLLFDF